MGAQRAAASESARGRAASDGRSGRCSRGRQERVAATADVQRRACGGAGSSTCSARARACDAAEQSGSGERCGDCIAKVDGSGRPGGWCRGVRANRAGVEQGRRAAPIWGKRLSGCSSSRSGRVGEWVQPARKRKRINRFLYSFSDECRNRNKILKISKSVRKI
jgi:hypothetical protein